MRALVLNVADGIFELDTQAHITFVNPMVEKILCMPASALIGQPFVDLLAPEFHEKLAAEFKPRQPGVTADYEVEIPSGGGQRRTLHLAVSPQYSQAGQFTGSLGSMQDITERKAADRATQLYQLLAQQTKDIILFVRKADGALVEANQAACAAYGYAYSEILTRNIFDLRTQDSQAIVQAQMAAADQSGAFFETLHVRRDGSQFPVEVSSCGVDIGGEHLLLSVVRDISERKQAERELQAQRDFAHLVMETMGEGLAVLDEHNQYEYVNPAYANMLGWPLDALLGKHPSEFIYPPDRPAASDQVASRIQGASSTYEVRLVRADGALVPVQINGVPRPSNSGYIGAVAVITDLTGNKLKEAALRESEEKFALVFQSSPVMIAIAEEKTGKYYEVNANWLKTMGFTRDEVIGSTPSALAIFPEPSQYFSAWQLLQQQGLLRDHEITLRSKTGEFHYGLFSADWIVLNGKRYLLAVIIDITDRKNLDFRINEQLEELQRWYRATLGREERILELKQEVNDLLSQAGQPARYINSGL